ncbi:hypothetical protein AN639_00555 [Candidatus Epulonipiscium fishelsonii]|uniref:Uncharacterized protein n=1 Tax=Candidatus Epulonipiscium fishelsonii TaxID=77094 RepID=A0ACC8XB64_9FIRM|nr:hypothetical protein AN396_07215 [Epulopiscium sp. SCG-B11WGA-EpuloA1]ONI41291.1 hypothetical protein AN639_00555 [Epulopiscium sp. SCG-B05WGA-EpuloA1]
MNSPLAKNFSMTELLKYTLPSMIMMVFMSTYTIIDGVFVSSFLGEDALAAVNLVIPPIGIVMAVGLMFATGGNAVIAKLLGQGKQREAREFLTVIYIIGGILGGILTALVLIFPDEILSLLKVSDNLYTLAKDYMLSFTGFLVPLFFMVFIQSFMVTAGNPMFGLMLGIAGGITNIVLDYMLISPDMLNMGIAGAGIATGIGYALSGLIGFFYFIFNRKCALHFVKPKFRIKTLGQSMFNGSSEFVGSLATSITTLMFNFILMSMVGDAGVAAISVILYIQMFQSAIYMGYTLGVSPIIAFKYGEENHNGLHKVIMQSFKIISVASVLVIALTLMFSNEAVGIFIKKESATFEMTKNGLLLFLPAYLFMGFNIFFSAMFTSLSNGKVSAIISVLRSLVFILIALIVLPQIFKLNGVWLAVPLAEFLAIIVSIYYYKKNKSHYKY